MRSFKPTGDLLGRPIQSQLARHRLSQPRINRQLTAFRATRSHPGLLIRQRRSDGYRAALADEKAWVRSRRPKRCKLAINPWLRQAVASKLRLNWAPEQIAGWLKRAHPDGGFYRVSHETIYRSLFVQARGVLKKELLGHLRSKRTIRRSQRADPNGDR